MPDFCCPVCGKTLSRDGGVFGCESGHRFDAARQGYVNLLRSHAGGRRHGDDRAMVLARRDFLKKGFYRPILDAVIDLACSHAEPGCRVLDAGCGEGWYTAGLLASMRERGLAPEAAGVDISKDAVIACAARHTGAALAVASTAHLPFEDGSFDLVLNLFSPPETAEYARVLRKGGYLLRALPREKHLFSLKAAVYDTPYLNPPPAECPEGYETAEIIDVDERLHLTDNGDIRRLFLMTPYWYKTGEKDQRKLDDLTELETELSVRVELLKNIT